MSQDIRKAKEPPACSCNDCKTMCEFPCIPTPDEARKLIDLGYGNRLMFSSHTLSNNKKYSTVNILMPAKAGLEGKKNKFGKGGFCNFQEAGLCQLHNICKPLEGRLASCTTNLEPPNLRDRVVKLWDNKEARQLVQAWINDHGKIRMNLENTKWADHD